MQDILEALADPIVIVDARREIVAANTAAHRVFPGQLVGRNIALSIRHPDVLESLEAVLDTAASREAEVTLPGAVATTYLVRAASVRLSDTPKEASALIAFHDLTAARQAEHMRADFVSNVSHELRSPLTSLLGFIETLRGPARENSVARERFLEVMDGEAKRMARLIDEFLSLSRVESEEHLPPQGQVDVRAVLREIARSFDMRAAERDRKIVVDCPQDLPQVLGERDEVTLVFCNLVENALNYGRAGTPVTITAGTVERVPGSGNPRIRISVRDRGEGIAPEHIANRHRGRLTIESKLGEGSVFTVVLPSVLPATG